MHLKVNLLTLKTKLVFYLPLPCTPVKVAFIEDGKEVEHVAKNPSVQNKSPLMAPLGTLMNMSGSCKALSNVSIYSNYHPDTYQTYKELLDTRSLRTRL